MNLTYNYAASAGQNGAGSTAGNSGQLMSISGTINATTESAAYTYDNLGRLATSNQTTNGVSPRRRFVYDRWSNRTNVYDATSGGNQIQSIALQQSGGAPTNRLTSVTNGSTTLNYSYDNNGNVLNDGVYAYQYDAENRVVSVNSGATATYAYNQNNQRVKKVIGATTTHYVWEGSNVLAEHNGSTGALMTNYTYAGSRMINKTTSGTTSYFLNDRLSARVVLNTSGTVVGRQATLPFGEDLNPSGTTDKHRFTSYERDIETDTDYAVNRQYIQSIGRFNRVDPYEGSYDFDHPQSLNRYSYVNNDPTNLIDPTGLAPTRETCELEIVNLRFAMREAMNALWTLSEYIRSRNPDCYFGCLPDWFDYYVPQYLANGPYSQFEEEVGWSAFYFMGLTAPTHGSPAADSPYFISASFFFDWIVQIDNQRNFLLNKCWRYKDLRRTIRDVNSRSRIITQQIGGGIGVLDNPFLRRY